MLSLSTLCTVSFVRNHCLAQPYPYPCRSQPHIQEHDVEIRTLLTSHTLYQQTNTTMDTFLIRKSQKEKPVDFFKHERDGLQQQRTTISKQCLEASYVVAHRIAKLGQPHTIAETRILPAAQDV